MSTNEDAGGIKSAYELAMEKLERAEGASQTLSDEQKQAIADIEQRAQAEIAQAEILMKQKILDARTRGAFGEVQSLEADRTAEIGRIKREADAEKERIRMSS